MKAPTGKLAYAYNTIRNMEAIIERQKKDCARYEWLRSRDLEAINRPGIFSGMIKGTDAGGGGVVLNGEDLDEAIDSAMTVAHEMTEPQARGGSDERRFS